MASTPLEAKSMLTQRPITDADHDLLWRLFLLQTPPTIRTQGQDILSLFFQQTQHQFGRHQWHIIEIGGEAVGQIVLTEEDSPCLLNLALLPSHQNMGFGSSILRQLQAEHDHIRVDITTSHRARNLLERLGFERVGVDEDLEQWTWQADETQPLNPTQYERLIGESFQVMEHHLALTLLEVERLPVLTQPGASTLNHNPFAMIWLGPTEHFMDQQTVTIQHPDIGDVMLFMVPRAQRDDGFVYETIIN